MRTFDRSSTENHIMNTSPNSQQSRQRNRRTYAILSIFGGGLGLHRIYVGGSWANLLLVGFLVWIPYGLIFAGWGVLNGLFWLCFRSDRKFEDEFVPDAILQSAKELESQGLHVEAAQKLRLAFDRGAKDIKDRLSRALIATAFTRAERNRDDADILKLVTKDPGADIFFPCIHPVYITAKGIDFAIVAEVAVWMGPIPTGEGVGAETGVYHGNGDLHVGIVQFRIELPYLLGKQHPFVDDGSA
jgi:TM2 domain-containing membrane protein YozV